jgi:hypothetical protein
MRRRLHWSLLIAVVLGFVALPLAGCGGPGPTPTPTKTPRPELVATDTPIPPTSTPQPPIQVATATPSKPTPLPTISGNVWPLTGLPVSDVKLLERPPIAVKISNSPQVRPQSGLQEADVVFEHLAEGGVTRYTAIFQSQDAERIGSLRSARLIDLEIPAMFQCALVYSGASSEVTRLIKESDFFDRSISDWYGDPGFYRVPISGLAYEHTLFTDSKLLWEVAQKKGWYGKRDFRGMRFDPNPPAVGKSAASISIPYNSRYSDVTWTYDAERGAYLHSILGEPHKDRLTDQQIGANNVVVVWVNHVETLIVEDELGSHSIQIQIWGEGKATVFRDGKAWDVTWKRPNRADPLTLIGPDGQLFPLKPGNTWYNTVSLDMKVTVK